MSTERSTAIVDSVKATNAAHGAKCGLTEKEKTKVEKQQYENGKLYQYNGTEFVELAPSTDAKVPVSDEAMAAVKSVRKAAQQLIRLRPELSLAASAMLLAASELPDIAERVQVYGQRVYSKADNPDTPDSKAGQGLDSFTVRQVTT